MLLHELIRAGPITMMSIIRRSYPTKAIDHPIIRGPTQSNQWPAVSICDSTSHPRRNETLAIPQADAHDSWGKRSYLNCMPCTHPNEHCRGWCCCRNMCNPSGSSRAGCSQILAWRGRFSTSLANCICQSHSQGETRNPLDPTGICPGNRGKSELVNRTVFIAPSPMRNKPLLFFLML
jgi:hypothetical protein